MLSFKKLYKLVMEIMSMATLKMSMLRSFTALFLGGAVKKIEQ
jgi:hypothetical protein